MTSRTNRHTEGRNQGGTGAAASSDLEHRRQLAVARYLDGDPHCGHLPRDGLCQKLVVQVEEALSGRRIHLGSGALAASQDDPEQNA
jgi:hypothetical protein